MDKRGIRNLGKLLRESGDAESFGEKTYGFLSELKEYKNAETLMLYLSLKKEAPTDELAEKKGFDVKVIDEKAVAEARANIMKIAKTNVDYFNSMSGLSY